MARLACCMCAVFFFFSLRSFRHDTLRFEEEFLVCDRVHMFVFVRGEWASEWVRESAKERERDREKSITTAHWEKIHLDSRTNARTHIVFNVQKFICYIENEYDEHVAVCFWYCDLLAFCAHCVAIRRQSVGLVFIYTWWTIWIKRPLKTKMPEYRDIDIFIYMDRRERIRFPFNWNKYWNRRTHNRHTS